MNPPLNLTPCVGLREIWPFHINSGRSLEFEMEPHLALLSSVSSPHLRKISLMFAGVGRFVRRGESYAKWLDGKE